MERPKINFYNVFLLIAIPTLAFTCFSQFEKGLLDFYQIPFDFFKAGTTGLLIFIAAFTMAAGMTRLFRTTVVLAFAALLFIATFLCPILGYRSASLKSTYTVLKSKPDFLLVDHFGDRYLLREFDLKTKHIGKKMMIMDISSSHKADFEIKETGRLKVD
jgi:hypothetical protein